MSRVKRGTTTKRRHKKLLKMNKGYGARRSTSVRLGQQAMMRAGLSAYRSRKIKKRDFRTLWNARISAAVKPLGLNYSRFIERLFKKEVMVNRKMLSEMAIHYPEAFADVVKKVQ